MPEIVLPGTYIEVRAEGLISAGGVVTGNKRNYQYFTVSRWN